jgi:hypothetical protein
MGYLLYNLSRQIETVRTQDRQVVVGWQSNGQGNLQTGAAWEPSFLDSFERDPPPFLLQPPAMPGLDWRATKFGQNDPACLHSPDSLSSC